MAPICLPELQCLSARPNFPTMGRWEVVEIGQATKLGPSTRIAHHTAPPTCTAHDRRPPHMRPLKDPTVLTDLPHMTAQTDLQVSKAAIVQLIRSSQAFFFNLGCWDVHLGCWDVGRPGTSPSTNLTRHMACP